MDNFIEYSFFEPPTYLEYVFESAWDTLSAIYPGRLLLTCDCFAIALYSEELEDIELNFTLGEINTVPYLLTQETGETILIKLNEKRWEY